MRQLVQLLVALAQQLLNAQNAAAADVLVPALVLADKVCTIRSFQPLAIDCKKCLSRRRKVPLSPINLYSAPEQATLRQE